MSAGSIAPGFVVQILSQRTDQRQTGLECQDIRCRSGIRVNNTSHAKGHIVVNKVDRIGHPTGRRPSVHLHSQLFTGAGSAMRVDSVDCGAYSIPILYEIAVARSKPPGEIRM